MSAPPAGPRRRVGAKLALLVVGILALASVTIELLPSTFGRELVLNERFDGARLSARHWRTCHWWADRGCTIASNHELESYWPSQVRVSRGTLRLVAERRRRRDSEGVSRPYVSGMISSGPGEEGEPPKFAFRYGRAQIRARVPTGRGLWSAFWLLPTDRSSLPEIDVLESLGRDPDAVELHVHWRGDDDEEEDRGRTVRVPGLGRGWHTFAIDWRPDRLTWLIDGKVRWRVRGDAVPHDRMYLIANLAVGGDWPGPPDSETRFPSALVIDSIKVWR